MSKLYISATKREEIGLDTHGGMAIVDTDSWEVLYKTEKIYPMPYCARNSNPRGGTRGWRGLACWNGSLVAANNDSLVFFDGGLKNVRKIISHPSFGSLHGIAVCEGSLYVASTLSDTYAVVDSDFNVRVRDPFRDKRFLDLIRPWLEIRGRKVPIFSNMRDYREEWIEDTSHLNYVILSSGGRVCALLNSLDMLVQLEPEPKILWAPPVSPSIYGGPPPYPPTPYLSCPHDLVEYRPGKLLINSSKTHSLHSFDMETNELSIVWSVEDEANQWIRGLQVIGNSVYVGNTYGTLIEVSLVEKKKVRELSIFSREEGLQHSIFSVCLGEGLTLDDNKDTAGRV